MQVEVLMFVWYNQVFLDMTMIKQNYSSCNQTSFHFTMCAMLVSRELRPVGECRVYEFLLTRTGRENLAEPLENGLFELAHVFVSTSKMNNVMAVAFGPWSVRGERPKTKP